MLLLDRTITATDQSLDSEQVVVAERVELRTFTQKTKALVHNTIGSFAERHTAYD